MDDELSAAFAASTDAAAASAEAATAAAEVAASALAAAAAVSPAATANRTATEPRRGGTTAPFSSGAALAQTAVSPSCCACDTILVVDDEEINRLILENIFAGRFNVEHAENGRIALDRVFMRQESYCAILLDVVMDEMDGMQVLQRLRRAGLTESIPVFLITANASGYVTENAYDLGVMDVIKKPVVPYIVQRRVESVIELFQARRRLSYLVEDQRSELLRRAEQIIDLTRGMVESLAAAIEFRDGESGGHVRRIHDITKLMLAHTQLGQGLTAQQIEDISLAAIMHDVGKIAIPDAILNKPGRLTPEEFEIMKTHTVRGEELLSRVPQLRESGAYAYAADIARHHHERWDGRGYPDGLAGDEISIWAQIVSLADVYDALRSDRPYKKAFSRETAIAMITNGECGAFNPDLLQAFVEVEPELVRLHESENDNG